MEIVMANLCTKCGTEIPVGEGFCSKCGNMASIGTAESESMTPQGMNVWSSSVKSNQGRIRLAKGQVAGILGVISMIIVAMVGSDYNSTFYDSLWLPTVLFLTLVAYVLGLITLAKKQAYTAWAVIGVIISTYAFIFMAGTSGQDSGYGQGWSAGVDRGRTDAVNDMEEQLREKTPDFLEGLFFD